MKTAKTSAKKRVAKKSPIEKAFISLMENAKKNKEVRCQTCGYYYSNPIEIEMIMNIGECSSCDHIRGECLDEICRSRGINIDDIEKFD